MKKAILLLHFLFVIFSCPLFSQTYEIRAIYKDVGVIGVEMRATGTPITTNNYVTDIVFGLKWSSTLNVDLASAITTSYNIKKSDVRKLKGTYNFQAFYADNTPYLSPSNWPQNSWIEIMRIANNSGNSTGTYEICETNFDPTTDPNLGIDLTDYTPVINGSASGSVLPVNLLNFDVASQNTNIVLSWQTATETNNNGFVVQRSTDASDFDSIGWMPSKGNSTTLSSYIFLNKNVRTDVLYFYRLKQEDLDGGVSFSATRSIRLDGESGRVFNCSPNPVVSMINVHYTGSPLTGKAIFKIIDGKGQIIQSLEKDFGAGIQISLDLSQVSNGQYYLIIEQENTVIYKKAFVKI